ncbi:zinc ribbon domain-containing protein [Halobacteriaceae archaeon GCM10025711]
MLPDTEYWVYVSLGIVLTGFLVLLLFLGPIGWILAVFLLAGVYLLLKWSGLLSSPQQPTPSKVNCTSCGALNPVDQDTCSHCGNPLNSSPE